MAKRESCAQCGALIEKDHKSYYALTLVAPIPGDHPRHTSITLCSLPCMIRLCAELLKNQIERLLDQLQTYRQQHADKRCEYHEDP
jgi:hypothetical protein